MLTKQNSLKIDVERMGKRLGALREEVEDEVLREIYAPVFRNAVNEYLSGLGWVDEMNGSEAAKIPDLVSTSYELIQLVRFWVEEYLDFHFHDGFRLNSVSSSGCDRAAYACRRINKIEEVLGQEQVQEAVDQAYQDFGKKQDQRIWDIFLNGDEEQRQAFYEEQDRALSEYNATDSA